MTVLLIAIGSLLFSCYALATVLMVSHATRERAWEKAQRERDAG